MADERRSELPLVAMLLGTALALAGGIGLGFVLIMGTPAHPKGSHKGYPPPADVPAEDARH